MAISAVPFGMIEDRRNICTHYNSFPTIMKAFESVIPSLGYPAELSLCVISQFHPIYLYGRCVDLTL